MTLNTESELTFVYHVVLDHVRGHQFLCYSEINCHLVH